MKVSIEDNSIPNSALLDGYSGCFDGVASSSTATTDSSIITLVAGEDISVGDLVGIVDNKAVKADYAGIKAIGVALNDAITNANINIKISGFVEIYSQYNGIHYLGANGGLRFYPWEPDKYLQRVGNIYDSQLFIDLGEFVLMVGTAIGGTTMG